MNHLSQNSIDRSTLVFAGKPRGVSGITKSIRQMRYPAVLGFSRGLFPPTAHVPFINPPARSTT